MLQVYDNERLSTAALDEIGDALERLAALVADILDPSSPSKVVLMREKM